MSHANNRPWEDRWEELGPIGKGGQGETRRVKDIATGRSGVLKTLRNKKSPQARARMYQEVNNLKILNGLECKVPKIYDDNCSSWEERGTTIYFVMEFIKGTTLKKFVDENCALGLEESINVCLSLCNTLELAFSVQVSHRDIKPENIMIENPNLDEVYMVDFGLSFNQVEGEDITTFSESIDNSFLSLPERRVQGGNRRDPRSDITGLVGILYFCLTGQSPVDLLDQNNRPPHDRPGQGLQEKIEDNRRASSLTTLFNKAFQVPIDSRFQTIQELKLRLEEVLTPKAKVPRRNPLEAVKEAAMLSLRLDRQTQIGTYRAGAKKIITDIRGAMDVFMTKAKSESNQPFRFDVSTELASTDKPVSEILESLAIRAIIHAPNEVFPKGVVYIVAARQKECVVYRRTITWNANNVSINGPYEVDEWVEVFAYDGSQKTPQSEVVAEDFQAIIDELLTGMVAKAYENVEEAI